MSNATETTDVRSSTRVSDDMSPMASSANPVHHDPGCLCPGCLGAHEDIEQGYLGDVAPTIKVAGTPSVTILDEVAADAIPADTTTTAVLSIGGSVLETLSVVGDRDWFRVELTTGNTYEFDMQGTGLTPVNDPYLRLYDSNGVLLAENDDGGPGKFALIGYLPLSTGSYFIEAAGYADNQVGDYTISAGEVALPGELPVPSVQGTSALLGVDQTQIKYFFGGAGQLSNYGSYLPSASQAAWTGEEDWSLAERAIVRQALDDIEALINVTFVETMIFADAELDFFKNDDSGNLGTAGPLNLGTHSESSIRMNQTISDRWLNGKEKGGQGYETLVHEIGHALGLGHTHDTSLGSDVLIGMPGQNAFSGGLLGFNDPTNSIMAYRDGWAAQGTSEEPYGNQANFAAWDQQALINLYGAATAVNGGNDTYVLPDMAGLGTYFETINDTGGTDEISAGGSALNAVIDLRSATLDTDVETAGGPKSHLGSGATLVPGGFSISAVTEIENATGGTGNDDITGNGLSNKLDGDAGADILRGGALNDTLIGGAGGDVLEGGTGDDAASYVGSAARVQVDLNVGTSTGGDATGDTYDSIEDLIGSSFNDVLIGNDLGNAIFGGLDSDTIIGLGGTDLLLGGSGADSILGGTGNDLISGGNEGDTINGDSDNDNLFGNGGADVINGQQGLDTIFGGTGSDSLLGGSEADEISGQGNADTLRGQQGEDILRGGSGNDSLFGGSENDLLLGQGNNDTLNGEGGNDTLLGAAGADELIGGEGDDILNGSIGGDRLDGGGGNDTMNGGGADNALDVFVFMLGYRQDRINAFDQAGADRVELDEGLWIETNPEGLTAQEVVDLFGTMNAGGNILSLDFGFGDVLEIQNAGGIDQTTFGQDVIIV